MQEYFNEVMNRRGTNSSKWNVKDNELPLSTADMDFKVAPQIIVALHQRVDHGIFGYTEVAQEWKQSLIRWWSKNHQYEMQEEWLLFCTGTVPAISSIIRKCTTPAEKVVLLTPEYSIFFNSVLNNGRRVVESRLVKKGASYELDFTDLEEKLSDPETTLMILCNPHNPIGKIWDFDTLYRIGELCAKHNVLVISDEVHCDLTSNEKQYIPFAKVSEHCRNLSMTCIGPSKTFNLAGLQSSAVMIPNPFLRAKVNRALNTDEIAEPNAFAMSAGIAAYNSGEDWLMQLKEYLNQNRKQVHSFIAEYLPQLQVCDSEATYLLWVHCHSLCEDTEELVAFIQEKTGLILSYGGLFGGDGKQYFRMNIAYPTSVINEALNRLRSAIQAWLKK